MEPKTAVIFDLFGAEIVEVNGFIKDGKTYVEARELVKAWDLT